MTTEAVYKYLKKENRPHSANDVIAALDKEKIGKAVIQKSLDKLVDIEKIFCKVSNFSLFNTYLFMIYFPK